MNYAILHFFEAQRKGRADIGVPGAFFRGGQQFLSAKTQSCSAKKYPLRGGPNSTTLFCQADVPFFCVTLFCQS